MHPGPVNDRGSTQSRALKPPQYSPAQQHPACANTPAMIHRFTQLPNPALMNTINVAKYVQPACIRVCEADGRIAGAAISAHALLHNTACSNAQPNTLWPSTQRLHLQSHSSPSHVSCLSPPHHPILYKCLQHMQDSHATDSLSLVPACINSLLLPPCPSKYSNTQVKY